VIIDRLHAGCPYRNPKRLTATANRLILAPDERSLHEAIVRALRDIVRSARVKSVLERGGDTALVFVLRATNKVLADESQTPREIITRLWNILDEPELHRALGIPQNSRMKNGRKEPPARLARLRREPQRCLSPPFRVAAADPNAGSVGPGGPTPSAELKEPPAVPVALGLRRIDVCR
jgi:hypothetical protein